MRIDLVEMMERAVFLMVRGQRIVRRGRHTVLDPRLNLYRVYGTEGQADGKRELTRGEMPVPWFEAAQASQIAGNGKGECSIPVVSVGLGA